MLATVVLAGCGGLSSSPVDGGADAPQPATDSGPVMSPVVDASATPFWQWWQPNCGLVGGTCRDPRCSQVELEVSAVGGCATPTPVTTGCMRVAGSEG